jgi:hypothetical protein
VGVCVALRGFSPLALDGVQACVMDTIHDNPWF